MQSSKSSSVGSNEEFAEVLRSSWIRRLHLKPPTSSNLKTKESPPIPVNSPPPSNNGSLICNQTTISTDKYRTPISNLKTPTTPLSQQLKSSSKSDTIKCSFPGFGPFQLKNRATDHSDKVTVLREDDDHLVDNCPENVNSKKMSSFSEKRLVNDRRGTPLSPFFRYWPDSKKKNTPIQEQTKFTEFGTSPNTSSIRHPMCAPSLEALAGGGSQNRRDEGCLAITRVSSDNQYCLRIGGINCHEKCDNGGASRILRDHQQNVVLSQLERNVSANRNETGKASFWNMNRFRKAEVLSSMLHPCRSKRKTPKSFDESACVKFRKLGHED